MSLNRRAGERRKIDRRQSDRRYGPDQPFSPLEPKTREDVDQLRIQLEYELRMVRETVGYISTHGNRVGEVDIDAFLESYFLHVGFLLDFFFPTVHSRSRGSSVLDFTPEWGERETISELLNQVRGKAETLLGGMSFFRMDLPTKKEMAAVVAELEALRARFELLLKVVFQVPDLDFDEDPDQGTRQR